MEEQQLKLLEAALSYTSEGIVITDALLEDPGPRIIFANAAFTKITGYSQEEVLGKSPRILQGPQTDRTELHRLRQELSKRGYFHGQAINYRKDGQAFLMDWRVSPIQDSQGYITNYIAIQRDATEENDLQKRNQQADRLETIGRITSEIAHDFANLLTAILGFGQLLHDQLAEPHPSRKTARMIVDTALRARLLTQQLLSFSRTQDEDRQNLDLHDSVKQIEVLLRRLAGEHISTKILIPSKSFVVRATRTQLEQIVINLVTNARDAMPDGGELKIHAQLKVMEEPQTAPHGAVPGNYVELTVSDTGMGMSEETQARIFDPFFTTKPEGKGTGLGLASVYRHVQKLKGLITVESKLRYGTHFRVYIPAVIAEEQATS